MNELREKALNKVPQTIAEYFSAFRELQKEINENKIKLDDTKSIKIAILSSFTMRGIKEILFTKLAMEGIHSEIYLGEYNQYNQEIIDNKSALYDFNPDVIILFVDIMELMGEIYFDPYGVDSEKRKKVIESKYEHLASLVSVITERTEAKIILHNFSVPVFTPMGIIENKQEFGFIRSIRYLNGKLEDAYMNDSRVFVFDYDSFSSYIGKNNIMDYRMYYLADMKIDIQYFPKLCDMYISYVKPILSLTAKCLVLDLDNTLWGGIIGEDGMSGIKLGPTPEGRPFMEFQKYILSLYKRGVILAVNSKNNYDDAVEVIRNQPYMLLREDMFASMMINWNDKATNMKAIAEDINIGTDSLVFIDDDRLNREIVKSELPEVRVVDLPDDPAMYLKALMELNDFNTLRITEEDKKKGRMYAEQRKRTEFRNVTTDLTTYLRELKMEVTIEKADDFNIPRISQLTQKTNQFNMTTRRYMEEDIKKFASDDKYLVFSVKVADRFGDNGITGLAIVEKERDAWRIDTFLMSCRVLGRKIDDVMLSYIVKNAASEGISKIRGEFIPTAKNTPAKNFYKEHGFVLVSSEGEKQIWEYNINGDFFAPEFIRIIEK